MQQAIAAQFRAELARLDISARELARRMGVSHTWVTDRRKGEVTITIEDTIKMAPHLGLTPTDLFQALYPQAAITADTPVKGVDKAADKGLYRQVLTQSPTVSALVRAHRRWGTRPSGESNYAEGVDCGAAS